MKKLEDALHELNMAHTTWAERADVTDDLLQADKYSQTWLETEWGDVSDIQDKAEIRLATLSASTTPPVQSNTQNLFVRDKWKHLNTTSQTK